MMAAPIARTRVSIDVSQSGGLTDQTLIEQTIGLPGSQLGVKSRSGKTGGQSCERLG